MLADETSRCILYCCGFLHLVLQFMCTTWSICLKSQPLLIHQCSSDRSPMYAPSYSRLLLQSVEANRQRKRITKKVLAETVSKPPN